MTHPAENDAWCLCGIVDDRGDGTCGNCGRPLLADASDYDAPVAMCDCHRTLARPHRRAFECREADAFGLRVIPPAVTDGPQD